MKRFVGIFAVIFALALTAWASTEKVLWNFKGGSDGSEPWSNYFISDAKGNLYAATAAGGTYSAGTVFMLSPAGKETVLYEFKGSNGDGNAPHGHLAFDAEGETYMALPRAAGPMVREPSIGYLQKAVADGQRK